MQSSSPKYSKNQALCKTLLHLTIIFKIVSISIYKNNKLFTSLFVVRKGLRTLSKAFAFSVFINDNIHEIELLYTNTFDNVIYGFNNQTKWKVQIIDIKTNIEVTIFGNRNCNDDPIFIT